MQHTTIKTIRIFSCLTLTTLIIPLSFANKIQETNAETLITSNVIHKLSNNPITSFSEIKVNTVKNIVVLTGHVNTNQEVISAIQDSESVVGVRDVKSYILVKNSSRPLSDAIITAKIKGIYLRENLIARKWVSLTDIHVETKDGIVYLTGKAITEQVRNAIEIAKSVKGVKDVVTHVRVLRQR